MDSNAVRVGIGTATPQYTLDVNGTGSFSTSTVNGWGVFSTSNATSGESDGVWGTTSSPAGVGVEGENLSSGGLGVYGLAVGTATGSAGVFGNAQGASGFTYGVIGESTSTSGTGVYGTGTGVGVAAVATGTSGYTFGVNAGSASPTGTGVYGVAVGPSIIGGQFGEYEPTGVWGDTDTDLALGGIGVLGTVNNGTAGVFVNNSNSNTTLYLANYGSGGTGDVVKQSPHLLEAYGGNTGKGCTIDVSGTLNCEGTVTAVVPTNDSTRKISLYAVQSPENWFEDFGSGTLSNGTATIALDPTFTQTVNTGTEYHVFLTPKGDCKGLYVTDESATGFAVRELSGGTSNVAFDYRIVAKRSGYENVRLTDVTEQYKKMAEQHELRRGRAGQRPVRPSVHHKRSL